MKYLKLYPNGELRRRVDELKKCLNKCTLCPRECTANRLAGERGKCGAGEQVEISGYGPHFGEESPLVGRGGSGTIFFAFCSLSCVFCQNYETSRGRDKYEVSIKELAEIMIELQHMGCVNINLVTPTHYVPLIIEALMMAIGLGLQLPLVYNSSGYESISILRQLEGIIDIYLPDIKYAEAEIAQKYSRIPNYPQAAKVALIEMHRQVGDLVLDKNGVAARGLIIRHMVMPGGLAGTNDLMQFIAREVSPNSWINIMDQYYPTYLAHRYPEIGRRVTPEEFKKALMAAQKASPHFHLL
ncbi:MAG: radical SAM protein [Bacillota bacterium]